MNVDLQGITKFDQIDRQAIGKEVTRRVSEADESNFQFSFVDESNLEDPETRHWAMRNWSQRNIWIAKGEDSKTVISGDRIETNIIVKRESNQITTMATPDHICIDATPTIHLRERLRLAPRSMGVRP